MEDSNPRNIEDYKDNKQKAYHGKLLIYVQSLDKPGKAVIKLSSPGLKGTTVNWMYCNKERSATFLNLTGTPSLPSWERC